MAFQFYIALISIHALFLSVNHFIFCIRHEWKECSVYSPPATVVFLLFLVFEALLFAIFTAVMLGTQMQAIWHDETVRSLLLGLEIFTSVFFAGNRATEKGGGALGEKEPLEEHPGCVRSILAGLVFTVLESAAAQQIGFVFALSLIGTEFQYVSAFARCMFKFLYSTPCITLCWEFDVGCSRKRSRTRACALLTIHVIKSVYYLLICIYKNCECGNLLTMLHSVFKVFFPPLTSAATDNNYLENWTREIIFLQHLIAHYVLILHTQTLVWLTHTVAWNCFHF